MAGQQRQSVSSGAPALDVPQPEVAAPAVAQARGNEAAQASVTTASGPGAEQATAGAEGGDAGLSNYEAALGEFLGGELYKAIGPQLAYDKLSGTAKKAVEGALEGLVGQLGSLDNVTADPKALEVLGNLLKDKLDPLVDEWLAKNGPGLSAALTSWVGAHPRTIVLTALLAAAGAVLANVAIPTLKRKFALGKGLSADVEAKLGKIRALSLQSVRAKLSYESGPLLAAVSASHDEKGTTASASVTAPGRSLTADGTWDGKGLVMAGLNGAIETDAGALSGGVNEKRGEGRVAGVKLVKQDGKVTDTKDFQYNAGSGVFSVGLGSVYSDNGLTVERTSRVGSDGSGSISQSVAGQSTSGGTTVGGYAGIAHETTKTPFGFTDVDKLKLGMNYSREDLTAKLDAAFASNGNAEVSGSLKKSDGETSYGGDFLYKAGDSKLWEVGGFYGFKSKTEFRSFLLDYRYKSDIDQNRFGAMVEQELRGTQVRWQSAMTWGGVNTNQLDASVQASRPIDQDTRWIAGAHYHKDFGTGQNTVNPQVGVQYKGIPVLAEYDTRTKGVMLTITIPFGK